MKKIILVLIVHCLALGEIVHCSAQEIEWQNTIGGTSLDELHSIAQTTDGGSICAGYSRSNISGDKTENNLDPTGISRDYWIIKIDASGNIQWQNTIGGSDNDYLYSVVQTTDGGYICGGRSWSDISGDKTENCLNGADYWVIKLDVSGNIQWQNTIGGNDNDWLFSIDQTTDGGYVCGGLSISNISGDKTENSLGSEDYWIVKLDASGNIQWQNTIGGNSADELYFLAGTTDGGCILGGTSYSQVSGDKTEASQGYWDYWVIKLDVIGNIQWQNTIGGSSDDKLHSIAQTADGGYICGGYSHSNISGDKTENSLGSDDYWVVKLDASGNIQWQNTIGGNIHDYLYSISQTADGGYICGGHSESNISGDKTENCLGGWDYWVIKLDGSGDIQWQNTIGGSNHDYLYSVAQTTDGDFILGGYSLSNISGDKTENCLNGNDYWVVKITDKFNLITGKLFIDANSNLLQDTGELAVSNKQIKEVNTGRFAFSQQDGSYNLVVLDSGNFIVSPNGINYYTPVPATHTAYFSGIQQTDSLNDFAFQPVGVFNDLCIKITPLGPFRPGFNASYMISYENVGTTTLNPMIIFFPDNDVTFVSANPVANSVTADSVVWNFGPLAPFQTGSILVTVTVNLGTPIGTLINSGVEIDPVIGDANTACNYHAWELFVTGSVDPNAILVDRDTVLTTELSNPPYLNYIIWFQNTGNDTAFTAKVMNEIPVELDLSSFEFVAASHPVNIRHLYLSRFLEFKFDNIFLPDSNVNEPGSHGFVRYRIKPNTTLVAGDEIKNTAFIYFDFNQPVQTDTAVTEIVLATGMGELAVGSGSKQLIVFPNPASQTITITSSLMINDQCQVTIYDLFGREVLRQPIKHQNQTTIDISTLAKGVYLVQLNEGENVFRAKFLKQ